MIRFHLCAVLLTACTMSASANLTLPSILSDHMVLQRSKQTAIWGNANPGEKVAVTLGNSHADGRANEQGKWKVHLDLSAEMEGPFEMKVVGNTTLTVADVVVGEVWLCSGQSNMAFALNRTVGGKEEIAHSANPRLRQFRVEPQAAHEPAATCRGSWIVASPATAANFSAVGYYFGKDLEQKLNSPVGIVLSAMAGTVATAWISPETNQADPELKTIFERGLRQEADYPKLKETYVKAMPAWQATYGRLDYPAEPSTYTAAQVAETSWKTVNLPGNAHALGLPDAGAIWFCRTIALTDKPAAGFALVIDVGGPHDFDTIYWNGRRIGGMDVATAASKVDTKRYTIPPEALTAGDNILAIRLFTPTDKAGFSNAPFMDIGGTRTGLADQWLATTEFELPPMTDQARKDLPPIPNAPGTNNISSRLYNAMIAPLIQTTLAGVIWYQGEQDTGKPGALYQRILEALIRDWRTKWSSDLPFVLCQLPNYGNKTDEPGESPWGEIREAQMEALRLPRTAAAVLIDLGDKDVHPIDKKPVGKRIALTALGAFYGQKLVFSGPTYRSLKVVGPELVLSFDSTDGLVAKPLPADYQPTYLNPERVPLPRHNPHGDLEGFALCGEDKKWTWANARIEGQTVVVSSPDVRKPIAVRYAWGDNPTCNLYNSAGLPASPFQAGVGKE